MTRDDERPTEVQYMATFWSNYSGAKAAPIPTLFGGGGGAGGGGEGGEAGAGRAAALLRTRARADARRMHARLRARAGGRPHRGAQLPVGAVPRRVGAETLLLPRVRGGAPRKRARARCACGPAARKCPHARGRQPPGRAASYAGAVCFGGLRIAEPAALQRGARQVRGGGARAAGPRTLRAWARRHRRARAHALAADTRAAAPPPRAPPRRMGHWEAPPDNGGAVRSAYHVRELEVFRLMQARVGAGGAGGAARGHCRGRVA